MRPGILIVITVLIVLFIGGAFILYHSESEPGMVTPPGAMTSAPAVDVIALKSGAEKGNPADQTRLARLYLQGSVVKMNVKEALQWLRQATNQDYPDALAAWGELCQAGQGMPRSLPEALRLYQAAAQQGSVAAQYDLAYLYEQGSGVKQDEAAAAKWYQLAAEGGDPLAQFDIGQRYELGVGVATNRVEAFMWLTLAAAQGQSDSARILPGLKRQMSGDEVARAGQLVRQFSPRTAKPAH